MAMKRARKKQRVVLRTKVRQERWKKFRGFFIGKILAACLLAYGVFSSHQFLYDSDFFMIKSLEISSTDPKIAAEIGAKASKFKGKSTFSLNLRQAETELKKQLPVVDSLKVRRALPDGIKVTYTVRQAVARVKLASLKGREKSHFTGEMVAADADGNFFPIETVRGDADALPEIAAASQEDCRNALEFLKHWNGRVKLEVAAPESWVLRKVSVDNWNETNLYVQTGTTTETTRIVWGNFEASTFREKYMRLREVWTDLEQKQMPVEYVNLRGVPQRVPSVLGDREIVGRVLVRPKLMQMGTLQKG